MEEPMIVSGSELEEVPKTIEVQSGELESASVEPSLPVPPNSQTPSLHFMDLTPNEMEAQGLPPLQEGMPDFPVRIHDAQIPPEEMPEPSPRALTPHEVEQYMSSRPVELDVPAESGVRPVQGAPSEAVVEESTYHPLEPIEIVAEKEKPDFSRPPYAPSVIENDEQDEKGDGASKAA